MKRQITPHKGGRTLLSRVRVTPATHDNLATIKAATGRSAADVLETAAEREANEIKAAAAVPK